MINVKISVIRSARNGAVLGVQYFTYLLFIYARE